MSYKKQYDTDAQTLEYLRGKIREAECNADIAREAIQIAERYRRKADNQRMMLNQLQRGGDAEADRPTGEWIVREYCTNELDYRRWIEIECPFCGEKPTYEDLDNMNYCPNCGAKMKGENSESNNSTGSYIDESDSY